MGFGGREVEEFYDRYEEVCGIARDGEGMIEKEQLMSLRTCLKGSRRKIYENVTKARKNLMGTLDGPMKTYIKGLSFSRNFHRT